MPESKTHRKLHRRFAPIALPPAIVIAYLWGGWYMAAFALLGYVVQPWFDQDYDQIGITTSEADMIKTIVLAPLVGWSSAYAGIILVLPAVLGFPRGHQSFWSHFPPIGALGRLAWFWWPFQLVFEYYYVDSLYAPFWGLYVGLMAADWIHSLADLREYLKRKQQEKWRKKYER